MASWDTDTGDAAAAPAGAVGPILDALVVVRDLDAAVDRFTSGLAWQETRDRTRLPASRAEALRSPALTGRPTAEVGSGAAGRPVVQLVHHPDALRPVPLRTCGWAALELQVPDVHAAVSRARRAGFRLLHAPRPLQAAGRPMPLVAAQLAGPDGDAVYLTQISGELPNFELPPPSASAEIFICVYAARSLPAARSVLESHFAVRRASDREVAIAVLNQQFDLPPGTTHRISSVQLAGRHAIEFDQYPETAGTRSAHRDVPPAGILSVRLRGEAVRTLAMPHGGWLEVARRPAAGPSPATLRFGDRDPGRP